jgi:hypothetical protein
MLLFTYEKKGAATYLPHVDMLRAITRTLRRASIETRYSEGFSPHILLYFAPPIPVGVNSECEACLAATDEPPATFLQKYNAAAPEGLQALSAERTTLMRLAGTYTAAEYEIKVDGADKLIPLTEKIMSGGSYRVQYGRAADADKKPGGNTDNKNKVADGSVGGQSDNTDNQNKVADGGSDIKYKEARPLIKSLSVENGVLRAVLSIGQENLRADRLAEQLLRDAGLTTKRWEITRKKLLH